MRCFALAQAMQEEGRVTFVTTSPNQDVATRLHDESISIYSLNVPRGSLQDAQKTLQLAKTIGADWIVIDGYDFDSEYQQFFHPEVIKTMLIDDVGRKDAYWTDIILNQNIYATENLYAARKGHTKLLLGCNYTLLRREFQQWALWKRQIPAIANQILVTLGGSDPENVTARIVDGLIPLADRRCSICIVAGRLNPNYQELKDLVKDTGERMYLSSHIDDMPEVISRCDLVVTAGGSTCYELAFMAAPFAVVAIAENQLGIAQGLAQHGACINLGWHHQLSAKQVSDVVNEMIENQALRSRLSQAAKGLIPANGAKRVAETMRNFSRVDNNNWFVQ